MKLITNLEEKYKEQNEKMFNFRDHLKDNEYKRKDLKTFLHQNGQHVPKGVPALLDQVSDTLAFGALEKCKICMYGRFAYETNGYQCQSFNQWTSCKNKVVSPQRRNWIIPEKISQEFLDYLSSVENSFEARVFLNSSESTDSNNNGPLPEAKINKTKFEKQAKTLKIFLKSGYEVDRESKLVSTTHIFEDNFRRKYNAALIKSDIQEDKNSFFKIQLLEDNDKSQYWVFRSWGRIGTKRGGNKTESFPTSSKAVMKFERLYLEKTWNSWNAEWIYKFPKKYLPVEIDYENDNQNISKEVIEPSKQEVPVQKLITQITDINFMENIMVELEVDIRQMPLGRLSSQQINIAAACLQNILILILKGGSEAQFIAASNQFYVAVPHNVGSGKLPLLNTREQIIKKFKMLIVLRDVELNYEIRNVEPIDTRNPIDLFYEKIKTEIKSISIDSDEYRLIKTYADNTHGCSHDTKLRIVNIFKINRDGEDQRYEPYKNYENRKLLWHGSRLINFGGIFRDGLRITPPESYISGSMFGNGVYFADCVTKSSGYCDHKNSNNIGAILLCEVALGNMEEFVESQYPEVITDLIQQNKSCKGLGQYMPNPEESVFQGGVEIPLGCLIRNESIPEGLMYNEYIVYNVDRIKCKYLVQFEFLKN